MIIETFLRWADTAKASDRARAANALGRAWLQSEMDVAERQAALMAMTWLLDDPSPKVRLALAEAVAGADDVPRSLILPLAMDQPTIACLVIARSPVLTDEDLVDLAARGDAVTRTLIASRFIVGMPVAAAIAEIGGEPEIEALLSNPGAIVGRHTLRRIAERLGDSAVIREALLARDELPSDARHLLAVSLSEALGESDLVRSIIGTCRFENIRREACEGASIALAGTAGQDDLPALADHLRRQGVLTPAFLMQTLCNGKVEFFAAAIINLSGLAERRVRSILSDGRYHAIRALYEACGLNRELSELFVEATLMWRQNAHSAEPAQTGLAARLIGKFRHVSRQSGVAGQLMEMVERLQIAEQRQSARAYASFLAIEAA